MKQRHQRPATASPRIGTIIIVSMLTACSLTTSHAVGENITRSSIASGGGISHGGPFKLAGTIGQPEVGPEVTGGNFNIIGGFLQDGSYFPLPVKMSLYLVE